MLITHDALRNGGYISFAVNFVFYFFIVLLKKNIELIFYSVFFYYFNRFRLTLKIKNILKQL
jgi:hypothetical protein